MRSWRAGTDPVVDDALKKKLIIERGGRTGDTYEDMMKSRDKQLAGLLDIQK